MLDAEALLLVDHQQTEVAEAHVVRQQPVRPDHDVDVARGEPGDDFVLFLRREKPRQRLNAERVVREPLAERLRVLRREQRRRHEDADLRAVLHCLERGSNGHFRLAEADVAANQPVHRYRLLHVGLHLVDRLGLVGCLLERERGLDLVLPRRVRREGAAFAGQSLAIQDDELLGDLARRGAHARLLLLEVGAAHAVERRCLSAGVPTDGTHLIGGDVELVVAAIFEQQVVARHAADGALHHAGVAGDAVVVVHDVIAGREGVVEVDAATSAARPAVDATATGEVGFGEERDLHAREHDAPFERRDPHADDARRAAGRLRLDAVAREDVREPVGGTRALGRDHDPVPLGSQTSEPVGQPVGVADHRVETGCREERRVGALRCGQHAGRRRLGVCEQPVEGQRQLRERRTARTPGRRERRGQRGFLVEQLLRTIAHPPGFAEEHDGVDGKQVGQQALVAAEPRQPRLHAVERDAVGQALPRLGAPGLGAEQLAGAFPNLVGGKQLAGRKDDRGVDVVG